MQSTMDSFVHHALFRLRACFGSIGGPFSVEFDAKVAEFDEKPVELTAFRFFDKKTLKID